MILSCVIASSSLLITSSIKIKHVNKYTLSIKIWCKQKKLNQGGLNMCTLENEVLMGWEKMSIYIIPSKQYLV
jgi:hypothetical protein